MSEQIQKARMQQKRDSTSRWEQASGFVPKPGELVIISDGAESTSPVNSPARIKVGDGVNSVGDLNFITGEVYTQPEEPKGAGNGALWINPEYDPVSPDIDAVSDWYREEGQIGFIRNKPVSRNVSYEVLTSNSLSNGTIAQISENWYDFFKMSNISISLENAGLYKVINQYCGSAQELSVAITSNLAKGESGIFFLRGAAISFSTTSLVIVYVTTGETDSMEILGIICDSSAEYNGTVLGPGTHFIGVTGDIYIKSLTFNYTDLSYNEDFKGIFKDAKAANVYTVDLAAFLDQGVSENLVSLLIAELGKYKEGDILLVPAALMGLLESKVM